MKKFIKSVLIFTAILIAAYVPLLIISGEILPYWTYSNLKYTGGHSPTRLTLNEAKNTHNPDVIFFGSSHAYRGFDVRVFKEGGYTVFNIGTSSQSPMQADVLAKRYLKNIQPKMVVYEVFPNIFESGGIEGATDILSNDRIDSLSVNMAYEINDFITYNTLLFSYYKSNLRNDAKNTNVRLSKGDHYIPGGYVERDISYYRNNSVIVKSKINLNPDQMKHFSAFINRLKQQQIPFALVFAPMPKATYSGYTNTHEFDSIMKSYGPYYNYNSRVMLNDSLHFYDDHHLNRDGARIFSRELLKNKQIFRQK